MGPTESYWIKLPPRHIVLERSTHRVQRRNAEPFGDYGTAFELKTERRFDEFAWHFEQCLSERDQLFGR